MAGRIWIGPYKPLGVSTQAVPGGGYLNIDASAGNFGPSPLAQLGLQVAQGATGIAGVVAEQLAGDNEATVKNADARMGETEQALLFDPQNGFLNLQGQAALTQAPAVLDTYTKAQDREMTTMVDDDQRRMIGELADRRLATFSTQIERHTAAERQRWYDTASDRRIALMQADAGLHWNDDALLRRSLGTARAEVGEQAERKGWDAALTEAALRQQTSRTLVAAIGAAVDRDPKRAQSLRTRYEAVIDDQDRTTLDALLAEAQTRERAQAASNEILNATPPDGAPPTPHWRLQQVEAITDPAVRAATIRRVLGVATAAEARARALGEQVLARVLKEGLTDPSQIPVREWVALDTERRQAIETRLDHTARNTEPAPNPALVDELATEMTQAPHDFARRDLVPAIAHLPLLQWQRFRDWQAGLRRNEPTTEEQLYAIKRGLQLATKMLPVHVADGEATNTRAGLVEDIDTQRRITGKSPDDADIADMLARYVPTQPHTTNTLEWDPRARTEITQLRFGRPPVPPGDRSGIHRAQANRMTAPAGGALAELRALAVIAQRAVIAAQRELIAAEARLAAAQAAAQAAPGGSVAAALALQEATRALEATAKEYAELQEWEADLKAAMADWTYEFSGQRFPPRIAEKNEIAEAARLGFLPTDSALIDAQGRQVFVNPDTGQYIVRAIDPRTPGAWELFDADRNWLGFHDYTLKQRYPDPPLKQFFPNAMAALTPEQKKYREMKQAWERRRAALLAGGASEADIPPPPEDPDETPEAKARKQQEEEAKAAAELAAKERYTKLGKQYGLEGDSANTRRILDNLDTNLQSFVSSHKNARVGRRLDSGMLRNMTVRDALKDPIEGDTVRKILLQLRF
jgi:hypothetical protein